MLSRMVRGRRSLPLEVPTRVRQVPLRPDSMRPRLRDGQGAARSRVDCAAPRTPAPLPQRRAAGCHDKRRSTAAIIDAVGRGGQPHCCASRCDKLPSSADVDGNAHIRAEDRGAWSHASGSRSTGCSARAPVLHRDILVHILY